MPVVYMDPETVFQVPKQTVKINNVTDATIVCSTITAGPQSTVATFRAPFLYFDSNKLSYFTSEVAVWADSYDGEGGFPIFRGVMDGAKSILRGENVVFPGRSLLGYLRSRPTGLRDQYRFADETRATNTFAGPFKEMFLDYNPYVLFGRIDKDWQPWEILQWYVDNRMDSWFKDRITFHFDPTLSRLMPRTVTVSQWVLSDITNEPVMETLDVQKMAIGDQVFRLTTWGSVIDFVAQLMPGVQVFERFNDTGAEVWFMYPWSGGNTTMPVAKIGEDVRTTGAVVSDLEVDTSNADTVNRVAVVGLPAATTITLMSEMTLPDEPRDQIGLIPDWNIYDLDAEEVEIAPLVGFGFDYTALEYLNSATVPQMINKILTANDPHVFIFKEDMQWVGRRWRLPNWFAYANLERGADIFVDSRTGDQINFQAFVEVTKIVGDTIYYDWQLYTLPYQLDWQNKRLILAECPLTDYIKAKESDPSKFEIDHDRGKKLCRVALTFTYSIQNFVPYADTYIQNSGVIDADKLTGIATGQALMFERHDLGFSQLTNINMPLGVQYIERVPITQDVAIQYDNKVGQEVLDEQVPIDYDELIISASVGSGENIVRTFIDNSDNTHTIRTDSPFDAPKIIRDDTAQLHAVAFQMLSMLNRRARKFKCALAAFSKAVQRGMSVQFLNINGGGTGSDWVESVEHDLEAGQTFVTTTNQLGNMDYLTTSHTSEISYA